MRCRVGRAEIGRDMTIRADELDLGAPCEQKLCGRLRGTLRPLASRYCRHQIERNDTVGRQCAMPIARE
jgi:hypothetical protein